jgi:RHS repeat-associated protein
MKRILSLAVALATLAGACSPSNPPAEAPEALASRQPLAVPWDSLVTTEESPDGRAAGTLSGLSGVSPDGAATYSMPLWVPAGRAGLQPELALQYDSDQGNGILGLGWGLSGLSRISRCGKTVAQDGVSAPVTFTHADVFCLDGQRLVAVSGAYGASNTEYRTEQDSFSRIVSLDADASGPTSFRVYRKNGQVLTYGALNGSTFAGERISVRPLGALDYQLTRDGRVNRYQWALARVEDRSGNYLSVHYTQSLDAAESAYEHVPSRIEYTGSSLGTGTAPTRFIEFSYDDRTDKRTYFVSGFKLVAGKRLRSISIYGPRPATRGLLRGYNFSYTQEPVTRSSLLSQVEECDNTSCKQPVTFSWAPVDAGYDEQDTGLTNLTQYGPYASGDVFWLLQPADVDGDGREDLLYRAPSGVDGWYKWQVMYSSVVGPSPAYDTSLPHNCTAADGTGEGRWGDLNLDGRADVLIAGRENCGSSPSHWLGTYLGGTSGFTWLDNGTSGKVWLTDLQGDGLPEPVQILSGQLSYRPNVAGQLQPFQPLFTSGRNNNLDYAVNIDGSARASLLMRELQQVSADPLTYEPVGKRYWAASWRDGVFTKQETTLVHADVADVVYVFADINGDGLPDAIRVTPEGGDLAVQLNTGDGFAAPELRTLPAIAKIGAWTRDNGLRVGDFNSDGRQDLLLMDGLGTDRTQLVVLESQGTTFTARPLSIPVGRSTPRGYVLSQTLDANGDGLPDLAQVVNGTLRLYTRRGHVPGLLSSVTDSQSALVRFKYLPLTDSRVHTPGTGCGYPATCATRGRWVVSEHVLDTGDGNTMRTVRYRYEDGRMDATGRGWLGFRKVTATDFQTGVVRTSVYDNTVRQGTYYPLTRRPSLERFQVSSGGRTVLRERTTVHQVLSRPGADGRSIITVFPEQAREVERDYLDAQGPGSGFERVTDFTWRYDPVYGNLTQRTQSTVGGEHQVWNTTYSDSAADWLIGLVAAEETSSTRAGRTVTRRQAFEYYPGTRLLKKETLEPGDAQLEVVTTHVRAPDGLVTQVTREGRGYPARTRSFTYDTVDRTWPASMTNEAGHSVQYAYQGGLGVLVASSDENGVLTRWQYDGYGRLRKEDGPTAADTTVSYTAGMLGSGTPLLVTTTEAGGQETVQSYDRLGREVVLRARGFNGSNVYRSVVFDVSGRIKEINRPDPQGGTGSTKTVRTYDLMDRLLREVQPDGSARTFTYEGRPEGFWVRSEDEKGNTRSVLYDVHGRPVRSEEPRPGGGILTTRYEYGPFGLLERVVDTQGNTVTLEYDRLGRRTRVQDPDSGNTLIRFNPFGEVMEILAGNGGARTYTRDTLGRQLTLTTPEGVSRFVWDTAPHGVGMLASGTQEGDPATSLDNISTAYSYDALGRPSMEAWNVEGRPYALEQAYDAYGRLQRLKYPAVRGQRLSVDYGYTAWGEMASVKNAASGHVYWQATGRNGLGQLTSESYGNGVMTKRLHDVVGRLRFIDSKAGTAPLQALAFEYERNGNLRSRHDLLGRTTEDFTYDSLDRLKQWSVFQNCRSSVLEYAYDDLGNLKGWSTLQGSGTSQALTYGGPGAGPHAVTGSLEGAYTYDGSGNQLTAPGRTVDYTAFNLPKRISDTTQSVSYRYNAHGLRTVKRSTLGTETFYVGGLYEERRLRSGDTAHVLHIRGAERTVAQVIWETSPSTQVTSQRTLYLHTDHLGSPETLTDEGGQVVARMKYTPFGTRAHTADLPQSHGQVSWDVFQGYTGHEHDEEFGLINMRGRIYDPRLGRFLSPDPIVQAPLASQSFNRYSYVFNNPLRYTDPSGYMAAAVVTYYDSWYGGYVAVPGGGGVGGSAVYSDPYLRDGELNEDIYVTAPGETMSPEFRQFLWRMLNIGGGGTMGVISGVVPGGHQLPVPEDQAPEFYRAYSSGMAAVATLEAGLSIFEIAVGGLGIGGGGAFSVTGVGAAVGLPTAALGFATVAVGVAVGVEAKLDYDKSQQVLQMSNQSQPDMPRLDGTGKVHGQIPDHVPENWRRSDLEDLADDLRGSIQTRKNEQNRLGEDGPHRERLRQEERLLRQIERILGGGRGGD